MIRPYGSRVTHLTSLPIHFTVRKCTHIFHTPDSCVQRSSQERGYRQTHGFLQAKPLLCLRCIRQADPCLRSPHFALVSASFVCFISVPNLPHSYNFCFNLAQAWCKQTCIREQQASGRTSHSLLGSIAAFFRRPRLGIGEDSRTAEGKRACAENWRTLPLHLQFSGCAVELRTNSSPIAYAGSGESLGSIYTTRFRLW